MLRAAYNTHSDMSSSQSFAAAGLIFCNISCLFAVSQGMALFSFSSMVSFFSNICPTFLYF